VVSQSAAGYHPVTKGNVTALLLTSNVRDVERYAEVLSAGWPGGSDASGGSDGSGGAEGWLAATLNSLADDITAAVMREVEQRSRAWPRRPAGRSPAGWLR
jgi:hypothetical protein